LIFFEQEGFVSTDYIDKIKSTKNIYKWGKKPKEKTIKGTGSNIACAMSGSLVHNGDLGESMNRSITIVLV
jgi:hypothetical protein